MRRVWLSLLLLTQPAGPLLAQTGRIAVQNQYKPAGFSGLALPSSSNDAPIYRPMGSIAFPAPAAQPTLEKVNLVESPAAQPIKAPERRDSPVSAAKAASRAPKAPLASRLSSIASRALLVLRVPSSLIEDRARVDFTVPPVSSGQGDPAAVQADLGKGLSVAQLSPPSPMNVERAAAVPAPRTSPAEGCGTWAFLSGTFFSQLANNAIYVTLPLVIYRVTHSSGWVGIIAAVTTALDAVGTLWGGRLADRLSSGSVLVRFNAVRAAALSAIFALPLGEGALPTLVGIAGIDALARGITDSARNSAPPNLAEGNGALLKRINCSYQISMETGAIAGPFLVGSLLSGLGVGLVHWVAPVFFGLSALFYLGLPSQRAHSSPADDSSGIKMAKENSWFRYALLSSALLTLYSLKSVLTSIFAEDVLHAPAGAAGLLVSFGLGGIAASLLYRIWHGRAELPAWLKLGSLGGVLLGLGWIPGLFWPAVFATFSFSMFNTMARLSLVSEIQSRVPRSSTGSAMGLVRFSANIFQVAVKFLVGISFAAALTSSQGFLWVAGGIIASSLVLFWVSCELQPAQLRELGRRRG